MTGTREKWFEARLELLKEEKELTQRNDELAQRRREPEQGLKNPYSEYDSFALDFTLRFWPRDEESRG